MDTAPEIFIAEVVRRSQRASKRVDLLWQGTWCSPGELRQTTRFLELSGTRHSDKGAVEMEVQQIFKLPEPVVAQMTRRQFQTSLNNLKDLLEAQVPVSSGGGIQ